MAASTPAERLAALWAVTCDAWALSGRPWPDYRREDMPGRVLRGTEVQPTAHPRSNRKSQQDPPVASVVVLR